jgi:hypothetical protein
VATYRDHILMLGAFVFLILFAMGAVIRISMTAGEEEVGTADLSEGITPGALAITAFVLLLVRGLVDVQRSIVKDRALWSVLVSPVPESKVRAGLMLRTVVFQLGLLALVMGTIAIVLAAAPEKPYVPVETAPLVVLSGVAAGCLPLPLLLSGRGGRVRAHRFALVVLLASTGVFLAALQLEWDTWLMLASGSTVIVLSVAVTLWGAPVLGATWTAAETRRFRPSRALRRLPPLFSTLARGGDPVGKALFRREMVLNYPGRQRAAFAGLNVVLCAALITLNGEMDGLLMGGEYEGYYFDVVTPFMVGMGIYAVTFFQATMPLVDGITREGSAFWVLKSSPLDGRKLLVAKVRPLLAFLPLTVLAIGLGVPFAAGRGPAAIVMGGLGAVAIYLAFLGVGVWAGARYPNLDRHSNAPPDMVLAFYLMFACLILEAFLLLPVLAMGLINPLLGIIGGAVAVVLGGVVLWIGLELGAKALERLEVTG